MSEPTYAVKRMNPRFQFSAEAEITLRDGTWLPAQLAEISARGCYVDTLEPLPVGTEFELSISDGMNTCDLSGKVIYEHTGGGLGVIGMGVLFGNMGFEQHSAIDSWLLELAGPGTGNSAKLSVHAEVPLH
ncbi:MAG TPA: PilZ domain-containing protein [Candidatus Acidoferrales bacterium]